MYRRRATSRLLSRMAKEIDEILISRAIGVLEERLNWLAKCREKKKAEQELDSKQGLHSIDSEISELQTMIKKMIETRGRS